MRHSTRTFGRQVYESEDYLTYNTIIEAIIRELVNDGHSKPTKRISPDDQHKSGNREMEGRFRRLIFSQCFIQ